MGLEQRKAERLAAREVGASHRARERADSEEVALPLGNRDRAPRIEEVEGVRGLQHLLVRWQGELRLEQFLAGALMVLEVGEEGGHIRLFEVVGGLLDFVLVEHVAVGDRTVYALAP